MAPISFAVLLSICGSAAATRTLFIFGDSYTTTGFNQSTGPLPSTTGNPLGNPPYPGSPWAKTPNWVDQLVVSCNQNPSSCGGVGTTPIPVLGYNYAQGGNFVNISDTDSSRGLYSGPIIDMVDQIGEYKDLILSGKRFASNESLYLSFFGINDLFFNGVVWTNTAYNTAVAHIKQDIHDYFGLLAQICIFGGRTFVTMGVMPVARQPFIARYHPDAVTFTKNLTALWNSEMQLQSKNFLSSCNAATHYFYDSAPVFNTILDNYAGYGAPNNTCEIKEDSHCLWYDAIHPYTQIHTALGKDVWSFTQKNTKFFQ